MIQHQHVQCWSTSTSPGVSKIGTRELYWAAQTKLTIFIVPGPLIALIGPKIKPLERQLKDDAATGGNKRMNNY